MPSKVRTGARERPFLQPYRELCLIRSCIIRCSAGVDQLKVVLQDPAASDTKQYRSANRPGAACWVRHARYKLDGYASLSPPVPEPFFNIRATMALSGSTWIDFQGFGPEEWPRNPALADGQRPLGRRI